MYSRLQKLSIKTLQVSFLFILVTCVNDNILHVVVQSLSRIPLFETPWTVAHQTPLSMEFPRQEYRSGLPFPFPGDLPDLGIKPEYLALAGGFFTIEPPGKPAVCLGCYN